MNSQQYDKAIETLQTAYKLDPSYSEAVINLAIALIVGGKSEEAEGYMKDRFGVEILPEERFISAYRVAGNAQKVVRVLEELVKANPASPLYHVELGNAYLGIGEKQKAIAEIEKAIELEPRFKAQGEETIKQIRGL